MKDNAAQIESLEQHEMRQQVSAREKNMEKAGEAFEAAMLIERDLGLKGIKFKDLPETWSVTRREHLVWRARMFKQVVTAPPDLWKSGRHRRTIFVKTTVTIGAHKIGEQVQVGDIQW